jgi:hypothetical protein
VYVAPELCEVHDPARAGGANGADPVTKPAERSATTSKLPTCCLNVRKPESPRSLPVGDQTEHRRPQPNRFATPERVTSTVVRVSRTKPAVEENVSEGHMVRSSFGRMHASKAGTSERVVFSLAHIDGVLRVAR